MRQYILSVTVVVLSLSMISAQKGNVDNNQVKESNNQLIDRQNSNVPEMSEEYIAARTEALTSDFQTRNTVVVDQFGNGEYTTIQEALNETGHGTTIQVNAGVYYENLYFDCEGSRHLKGAGMDASIIYGIGTPLYMVGGCASEFKISGFTFNTLNNSSATAMIEARQMDNSSNDIIIEHCKFPSDSDETAIWVRSDDWEHWRATLIIRNNVFEESSFKAIDVPNNNYDNENYRYI